VPQSTPGREAIPPAAWRAARAGAVGTFVEYFDFMLYGALTVFFAPAFFPSDDPAMSFLAGLAVFGAGFFARPVGAIVFGRIGDRRGRRTALIWSVTLMGLCSSLVGLLPTYEHIGLLAPILLTLLRLGQGVSAGAELLGAITYVLETAPSSRRGFLASFAPFGSVAGSFVGLVLIGVLSGTLGTDAMNDYGWRIPFLIAIPLALIALWMRVGLEDSPEFQKMAAKREIVKSPLRETLRIHRRTVLLAGGIAIGINGAAGMQAWFATFLVTDRDISSSTVFLALALSALTSAMSALIAGRLVDRYGRRRMTALVLAGFAVTIVPVLWVLDTATSFLAITLALVVFNGLSAMTMPTGLAMIAELYPRRVRYTAANVSGNIGMVLGSGLAPVVAAQFALWTGSGVGAAFWIAAVVTIGLVSLRFVAETGGRPLS
jgi:MHS family proline/betaine transporter-like MFS transporter